MTGIIPVNGLEQRWSFNKVLAVQDIKYYVGFALHYLCVFSEALYPLKSNLYRFRWSIARKYDMRNALLFLTLLLFFNTAWSQMTLTTTTQENTNCNGVDCVYDGPSILINEIMLMPPGNTDGSLFGSAAGSTDPQQGEWIELFNPDECKSIDISCYYLGNNTNDGTGAAGVPFGGGMRIPDGTVVPPLGFVIIRGANAPAVPSDLLVANGGNTIELLPSSSNTCLGGNTRLWFPNAGGWFAFYDENGEVQDAVFWNDEFNFDRNGRPCVASSSGCPNAPNLASFNEIPNDRKNRIGRNPRPNFTFRRIPDGGNWAEGEYAQPTYGDCNSTCIPNQTITCTGSATVNINGGQPPFTIVWDDSRAQRNATANELCAGTYCVTVTDGNGEEAVACVTITDFQPTATVADFGPLCVNGPDVNVTVSPQPGANETGELRGTGVVQPYQYSPENAGEGEHEVVYIFEDEFTCSDTDTVVITVHPPAEPTPITTPTCDGQETILDIEEGWPHSWNFGVVSGTPFVPEKDRFYVVTATNDEGCEGKDSVQIEIIDPPNAGLDSTAFACPDETASLAGMRRENDPEGYFNKMGDFDGELDTASGQYTIPEFLPPGEYSFYFIAQPEAPCDPDTAVLTLRVRPKPEISNLQTLCTEDRSAFIVRFNITGGDPSSYNVLGYPGTITPGNPYVFESTTIPNATSVTFTISDQFQCGDTSVTVVRDCGCLNNPGTFEAEPIQVCGALDFDATQYFNQDSATEPGDVFKFFLHQGSGLQIVAPVDSNTTGTFPFNPNTMTYGSTYYVSTVVSASNGGNTDRTDPCYQVARGVPVVWRETPVLEIQKDTILCSGSNDYLLDFDFTAGRPPFDYDLLIGRASGDSTASGTIMGRTASIPFNPTEDSYYLITGYTDVFGCQGEFVNDSVFVAVQQSTTVRLSNTGSPCSDGITLPQFRVDVTGDMLSYEVVLANSLNSDLDTVLINTPGEDLAAPNFEANDSILYTVHSVVDAPDAICTPDLGGNASVYPTPMADISRDSIYCEGQPILFDLELTGVGPWLLETRAGRNTFQHRIQQARDTTLSIAFLAPGSYTLTVDQITDEATGCTGVGSGSVDIVVNPSPRVELFAINNGSNAKNTAFCDGSGPATLLVEGFPDATQNYQVSYSVVGTPDVAYPDLSLSASNNTFPFDTVPGTYEIWITEVRDNSSAGCAGIGDTVTVVVHELPTVDLEVLDDTICQGDLAPIQVTLTDNPNFTFDVNEITGRDDSAYTFTGGNQFTFDLLPEGDGLAQYRLSNLRDGSTPQCASDTVVDFNVFVVPTPQAYVSGSGTWCEGTDFEVFINVNTLDSVLIEYQYGGQTATVVASDPGVTVSHRLSDLGTSVFELLSVRDFKNPPCEGVVSGTFDITIQANPTATIAFNPDPVCLGESVDVVVTGNGNGPYEVDVVDDQGNTTTLTQIAPRDTIPDIARNGMEYTVVEVRDNTDPEGSATFCSSQPNSNFAPVVNELPTVDFIVQNIICENDPSLMEVEFTGQRPFFLRFSLSTDNREEIRSNIQSDNYEEELFPPTTADVSLDSVADGNNCTAPVLPPQERIEVSPNPIPDVRATVLSDCVPLITEFTASQPFEPNGAPFTVGLASSEYRAGSNVLSQTPATDTWRFDEAGVYDLVMRLESEDGCVTDSTIEDYFHSNPYPVADFMYNPNTVTVLQNTVQFSDLSTSDANQWEWQFSFQDTLSEDTFTVVTTERSPLYEIPLEADQTLDVRLVVANEYLCYDTTMQSILVNPDVVVFVPTSFSPDNDGLNDAFQAVFSSPELIQSFDLQIYNRWGQQLHAFSSLDQSWDGSYQGEDVQRGVYVWVMHYRIQGDDESRVLEGRVTVLR